MGKPLNFPVYSHEDSPQIITEVFFLIETCIIQMSGFLTLSSVF